MSTLRAIGCLELNSIAMGMHSADEMVKAAEVALVMARPTCPGRYLVVVSGDTGAVNSAVERAFDLIDKTYNPAIKAGKDMLSAAVFLMILANVLLWTALLASRLL